MIELDTIYINGHKIGYQFNQKSIGSRTIKRRVHRQKDGVRYILFSGYKIVVVPLTHNGYVFQTMFEAVRTIPQY